MTPGPLPVNLGAMCKCDQHASMSSVEMGLTRRDTRSARGRDYEVAVRVLCDRCGRLVAELYGNTMSPAAYWSPAASGLLGGYGRIVRWRCSNGHDHPARAEKLTTAYRAVAELAPRQRVIRLPRDITGVASTGPFGEPL